MAHGTRDQWRLGESGLLLACDYVLTLPLGDARPGMILAQRRKSEVVDAAAGTVLALSCSLQTNDQGSGSARHAIKRWPD
jgi:hypothetical protein